MTKQQPNEIDGFTIMEVMVATVILSVGLLAAASMQISAIDGNASAKRLTETVVLAQGRMERLLALEYTPAFTDPDLRDDSEMFAGAEPYTDKNGNGCKDIFEPHVDQNGNGVWDAAHVDPSPPPGYVITWNIRTESLHAVPAKHIRVYVTPLLDKKTMVFICIKSMS
jgi:prepilin-type N-terminal cleavage/methylation domain-containing protein